MILVIVGLLLLGLCFGSFVNALVWRLHEKKSMVNDRSECPHCHHKLAVADLVPLFSWLYLKGKCRYCKKPIEDSPIVEAVMPLLFVGSYLLWADAIITWFDWVNFGTWLAYIVGLVALFVYDLKWYILPDKIIWPLIGFAVVNALVQFFTWQPYGPALDTLLFYSYGLLPIAGVYWLIYTFSKGQLVGFGDVKLGIFIGLALGWQNAFLTFLVANVLGTLVVLPLLFAGKLQRKSRVPFGPFLIVGFFIAGLYGDRIVSWYLSLGTGL
ncbi:MAG TPA: prepilin peptidase [Candidatus Saccharimonadales bacterium]